MAPRGTRHTSSRARRARMAATLPRGPPRIRTPRLARILCSSRRRTSRVHPPEPSEVRMVSTLLVLPPMATCHATCDLPSLGSTSSRRLSSRGLPLRHLTIAGLGAMRASLPTRCGRVPAWRLSGSCGAPCVSRDPRRCVASRPRLSGRPAAIPSPATACGAVHRHLFVHSRSEAALAFPSLRLACWSSP